MWHLNILCQTSTKCKIEALPLKTYPSPFLDNLKYLKIHIVMGCKWMCRNKIQYNFFYFEKYK
jgi:hypothetical protein